VVVSWSLSPGRDAPLCLSACSRLHGAIVWAVLGLDVCGVSRPVHPVELFAVQLKLGVFVAEAEQCGKCNYPGCFVSSEVPIGASILLSFLDDLMGLVV